MNEDENHRQTKRTLSDQALLNGKILFCAVDAVRALGYKNSSKAINDHCKKDGVTKCYVTDSLGRKQLTNFITEGNLYRLAAKSELPGADKFESWIFDEVIPSVRKTGGYTMSTEPSGNAAAKRADAMALNAKIRAAKELTKLAQKYHGETFAQVLDSYATVELTGKRLVPLPVGERKTHTATEIGQQLGGISANKVGSLTNLHGLKTPEYGQWYNDKSRYSSKEVRSFRYYENVIPVLQEILNKQ